MEKITKIEKYTIAVEVDIEEIFPRTDFTGEEVTIVENVCDKIHFDIESDKFITLSTNELILIITQVMRISKESPNILMKSPQPKPITKIEKTEFEDLNYIKLSEILTSFEIDDPNKMRFIRDYLNDRLQVDIEKDDLIVFEPTDSQHIILLIYDILKTFENESQEL